MPDYNLEDFSLSEEFSGDIVSHHVLVEDATKIRLDQFEFHCGLERGELDTLLTTPQNTIHGRADLLKHIATNSIILSPTLPVLDTIKDMVDTNHRCDVDDRQCYDEIFTEPLYDYMIIPFSYDGPIYVRHPESHEITRFDTASYADIPMVTLSLNPCFPVVQIRGLFRCKKSPFLPTSILRGHLFVTIDHFMPLAFYYYNVPPSEFPDRWVTHHPAAMLDYERLHFPPSLTTTDSLSPLGKRSRSASDDSDCDKEYVGAYVASECVQTWVTDSADAILDNEWEADNFEGETDEPVRACDEALGQGADWVEVMKRKGSASPSKKFKSDSRGIIDHCYIST